MQARRSGLGALGRSRLGGAIGVGVLLGLGLRVSDGMLCGMPRILTMGDGILKGGYCGSRIDPGLDGGFLSSMNRIRYGSALICLALGDHNQVDVLKVQPHGVSLDVPGLGQPNPTGSLHREHDAGLP